MTRVTPGFTQGIWSDHTKWPTGTGANGSAPADQIDPLVARDQEDPVVANLIQFLHTRLRTALNQQAYSGVSLVCERMTQRTPYRWIWKAVRYVRAGAAFILT